jgi:hypothetical protein
MIQRPTESPIEEIHRTRREISNRPMWKPKRDEPDDASKSPIAAQSDG